MFWFGFGFLRRINACLPPLILLLSCVHNHPVAPIRTRLYIDEDVRTKLRLSPGRDSPRERATFLLKLWDKPTKKFGEFIDSYELLVRDGEFDRENGALKEIGVMYKQWIEDQEKTLQESNVP